MTENLNRDTGTPDPLGAAAMPPTYPVSTGTSSTSSSTSETVKGEAAGVAQQAGQSARDVTDTAKEKAQETVGVAKDKAKETVGEARSQARALFDTSRSELTDQASSQQRRLAGGIRSFSSELSSMAAGEVPQEGLATDITRQVSSYLDRVGGWLEDREPGDVLDEVSRFARRRPGAFLAIAAGLGLVAGRVARSLKDESSSDDDRGTGAYGARGTGYGYGYGTTATGGERVTEYPPTYGTRTTDPGYAEPTYGAPATEPGYGTPTTGYGTSATGSGEGTVPGTYGTGGTR
jgi:vacuolar-type H+-ATPase subunit H